VCFACPRRRPAHALVKARSMHGALPSVRATVRAKAAVCKFRGIKKGKIMEWKWTCRFMQLAATAVVGGFCWILSAGVGITQETAQRSGTSSQSGYDQGQPGSTQQRYDQSRAYSNQSRDTSRQARDQWQDTRDSSRDTTRRGRDEFQDTRDQSRDAIGEARDDMRGASRQARDQFQDSRGQRQDNRDQFERSRDQDASSRDQGRFADRDEFRDQGQRDFSRGQARDQFQSQRQDRRDFSRQDDQRDQFQDRRDQFSDPRGQFDDRRGQFSDQRDQFRDERDQFSNRRESFRDDRSFQQAEQRSTRQSFGAGGRAQISRAADLGLWFDRDTSRGLVISDIASSGPITRFGFREGDQIISVNNTRVSSEPQFIQLLTSPQFQNQRVQVWVWRNGQQVPVWVEPWALLQSSSSGYAQADALEQFGLVLDDRYQSPVVWKVLPRSPAHYAGIRSSDVIMAWNGQHVSDSQELESLAQDTRESEIPVQLSRNRQLRQVTLEMDDSQSRTAFRPEYESYGTTDAIGAPQSGGSYTTPTRQSGTYYEQRTYTQPGTWVQPGTTYVQPGTTYVQPGTSYVQPGTTYAQPGTTYVRPGGTYVQPQDGFQQNRPNILPRLRGRE
jgi:C-terminal processing protease CtpA/Prc